MPPKVARGAAPGGPGVHGSAAGRAAVAAAGGGGSGGGAAVWGGAGGEDGVLSELLRDSESAGCGPGRGGEERRVYSLSGTDLARWGGAEGEMGADRAAGRETVVGGKLG